MTEAEGRTALLLRAERSSLVVLLGLAALTVGAAVLSIGVGAIPISPLRIIAVLTGSVDDPTMTRDALIVQGIRLPRTLLGLLVGAALAVSGALMQGLFRNPLADPALVGVSAGAGLAAACVIVLGDAALAAVGLPPPLPYWVLPIGAFFGSLAAMVGLYLVATRSGRTSVATMLLAGIALAAFGGAMTGLLVFASDDRQLRDLTFWTLGSLGGASWTKLAATAPAILPVLFAVPFLGRGLNALVLGEAEAFHLGISVERLKRGVILLVAVAVGASVAVAGIIGFVGLVVPHFLRLLIGPEHRRLLPACALLGGTLLVLADVVSRIVVKPAELPIGIVTALIGSPVFLWLLLGRGRTLDV
ncbi:iron ABC transporter permease [Methylobacterium sp. C25]|uniref:FecCD family ABC transporter permease n=1 Tax=Methylobacterium sp. C25 TaxID=2721622 RepID=UPI001F3DDABD|nr:iron ABC transporter permease [Methylobacterium sp. C25]MCE4222190.1 iron ABC transporter permease [Methylobacterium sp. C25]